MNEKLIRFIIILITAGLHIFVIFFIVFDTKIAIQEVSEDAAVMRLLDIEELIPEPPPPPPEMVTDIPQVEAIAERIIETEIVPEQVVVAAGTLTTVDNYEDYLALTQVTTHPYFNEAAILADIRYPPIALRTGKEGWVILDLFVDLTGIVQKVTVLREEPAEIGFAEEATRVFTNRQITPAYSEGEPVSCRFRYRLRFVIK